MADLSYCGDQVRRYDRGRFLTAQFVPAARRDDLLTLYAFNIELAKVREVVREPMVGRMRLQWWRDALAAIAAGAPRAHPVALPLAGLLPRLDRDRIARLIDAREADLDDAPPATLADLERYAEHSSATLVELALALLDQASAAALEAARPIGIAHALAGLLLAQPFRARHGRVDLPRELLDQARLHPAAVADPRSAAALRPVAHAVAARAAEHLAEGRRRARGVPKAARPALLVGRLARPMLRRLARADGDLHRAAAGAPPLAVPGLAWSMLTGLI